MLEAMVAGQSVEGHNNDMYCAPYDYYQQDYYPNPGGEQLCPHHGQHPQSMCLHSEYGKNEYLWLLIIELNHVINKCNGINEK